MFDDTLSLKTARKILKKQASSRLKKIFIVDDHPVFRTGLARILTREEGLSVCGMAGDAEKALSEIPRLGPDLALVDISLPGMNGLELVKKLRSLDSSTKFLIVSVHDEALYADRALRIGADGYIMKQEDPAEIIRAIRDVLSGHIYVSEEVLEASAKAGARRPSPAKAIPLHQLTNLQLQILELLGHGKSNQEIASQLRCQGRTVAAHCSAMQKTLHLESTNALVRYAVCWFEMGRV